MQGTYDSNSPLNPTFPISRSVSNLDFLFELVSLTDKLLKTAIQTYLELKLNPRSALKNHTKSDFITAFDFLI